MTDAALAEQWIDSLHEDANGLVWTTKAELRQVLGWRLEQAAEGAAASPATGEGLREVRADIEYRLTVGLRHIPGATESEERHYNDGQAFGLRYALERIDARLATPDTENQR